MATIYNYPTVLIELIARSSPRACFAMHVACRYTRDALAVIPREQFQRWFTCEPLPKCGYRWVLDSELHRENGPAINAETLLGWYQHGKPTRHDGPALMQFAPATTGNRPKVRQLITLEYVTHQPDEPFVTPCVINVYTGKVSYEVQYCAGSRTRKETAKLSALGIERIKQVVARDRVSCMYLPSVYGVLSNDDLVSVDDMRRLADTQIFRTRADHPMRKRHGFRETISEIRKLYNRACDMIDQDLHTCETLSLIRREAKKSILDGTPFPYDYVIACARVFGVPDYDEPHTHDELITHKRAYAQRRAQNASRRHSRVRNASRIRSSKSRACGPKYERK